jgi:hypothetical protein
MGSLGPLSLAEDLQSRLLANILAKTGEGFVNDLSDLGAPQEFVRTGILRGLLDFLKSDVFGVGDGHALRFQ